MNALFLVAATAVAFVFGYRFYAKLLALDVFRLEEKYSTPAQARSDSRDYVPTHPHVLFGHHVAAVTGVAVFAAPLVALGWGWVPAFLWITIGTAVAAGTYGLGSFWLVARHPENPADIARRLAGPGTRLALLVLMLLALLILVAAAAGFAATLLARFPGAALPLIAVAALAAALGRYLHGRAESVLLPASVGAFAAALLAVWLLGAVPLAFNGALTITLGGRIQLTIDAVLVWVVLVLVYAVHAARLPVWRLMRPRAFLTSLLLAVLLALFYVALIVERPALIAPEFHPYESSPGALPWLFLLVGGGAIAGWQLLIVYGVTGRELRRETDARYVGYGAALVQGLAALSALLLGATAFTLEDEWARYYADAPAFADLPRAAVFYVDQVARHVAVLGLDSVTTRYFAATVLAGLSLAVLEAGVRTLKHLTRDLFPGAAPHAAPGNGERLRLWSIVAAAAAVALHDGRGLGGIAAWPLLAAAGLWLAAAGFALIAGALRLAGRPALLIAVLGAAAAVAAAWSSVAQLRAWWLDGVWLAFVAGLGILLLALALFGDIGFTVWRSARARGP